MAELKFIRVVQLRFREKEQDTAHHWDFAVFEQEDFEEIVEQVREKFKTLARELGVDS
jgi:hypothetical protein